VLALAASALRRRPLDRVLVRVLLGAAATAAVLVPLSAAVRRGPAWAEFTRNLAKHTSVPSPNRMGAGTVIAFDRANTHRALETRAETRAEEVRGRWEAAQARSLRERRPLWILLAVAGLAAIGLAVRDQPAWAACTLGLLLVPLGRPLACYYYAFVAALPLLAEERGEVAGITVALALASGIVATLPTFGVDEQYVAQSLLVLLTFGLIASAFLGRTVRSQTR
jgi:hypothetical protein